MNQQRCRSCGAPIIWCLTPDGKRAPIDAEAHPEGNVWIDFSADPPLARYISAAAPLPPTGKAETLRRSHFATCPDAEGWRRKNAQGSLKL